MRHFSQALLLSSILLCNALPVLAGSYDIDIEGMHASVQFRIQHLGYSWLTGRFDHFSGHFNYDSTAPDAATVSVSIDTASINSNHARRDKHLRDKDFLYTSRYPTATFVSHRVEVTNSGDLAIYGNLTLRGVTREILIDAKKVGSGPDPWGGFRTGFTGTTNIKLKDFGIDKFLGPASTSVELLLDIEGIRRKKQISKKPH